MDNNLTIILGASIITIIVIVLILRKPIAEAIRAGEPFKMDLSLRGAKLNVGSPKTSAHPEQTASPPDSEQTEPANKSAEQASMHVDVKLVRFIPPLQRGRYRIVTLPLQEPPEYFNWPYSPTGLSVYYEIPFLLLPVFNSEGRSFGHAVLTVQPSEENVADVKTINAVESRITHVHFLISAGHGWREHNGLTFLHRRIGYLEISFSDGTSQRVNMILGRNIREWAFGNNPNLVTEIDLSLTRPAWHSHDSTKRFDLMSVQIENGPKDIQSIRVVGEFEDSHSGVWLRTPAIIVSAITCECSI